MTWLDAVDPAFVDRRLGSETVDKSLAGSRIYVEPPAFDPAGRLVAAIVDGGTTGRPGTPAKLAVRVTDDALETACACKRGRFCEHIVGLLVDLAFVPALHACIREGGDLPDLGAARSRALEERTLPERLAQWLPARTFDDLELDVEPTALPDGRSAVLLRHRPRGARGLVPARDVLVARLAPAHRALVELAVPHHADKNALVATRGAASFLVHLLRGVIGVRTDLYKATIRFDDAVARPRVERVDDRFVVRWYAATLLGDAASVLVFPGAHPYLWVGRTFHPIDPAVDLDTAVGMQRIPSLPIAGDASRRLLTSGQGRGVTLPQPEELGLPPLEKPGFELRLTGSPLALEGELVAVYAVGKVSVGAPTGEQLRDFAAEEAMLGRLVASGLRREGETLVANEDGAVRFWEALQDLRDGGLVVLTAASLDRTKIGPPVEIDVRVNTAAGWLDTELEFRAGALKVEIACLHRALVEGKHWVVLSDGSVAKLRAEVLSLVGEAALAPGHGIGKLPPHQFGRVARWIELADASAFPEGGVHIQVDPAARALRDELRARALVPRIPVLNAELRPYQATGLAWLQLLFDLGAGGLLADDMGLGKTLMTLALLAGAKEEHGSAPSLVVCPTSLVGNWLKEAARFTPNLKAIALSGSERHDVRIAELDLVVTTYGLLRRDVAMLGEQRFRAVILDEAQNIKNPASETARAAKMLQADRRFALTGTPVENRLSELWSLMSFVNPGMLGTAKAFDERYEKTIALRPDGAIAAELRDVVRPFILRRTKSAVLTELPPKTEVVRPCVFGGRQKKLYDALALAARQAISKRERARQGARTQLSVLTAILRLRQMACDPRLVDETARPEDSAKRAAFLDLVRELVSENRRALVFSQFVELLTLWRADLDEAKVRYEWLDGSTRNRDAVVDRFQNGDAPLFLISLKAGGAGLNLTAADTVIHCDPWWNPAAEDQATDRAHRLGQTKPVTVVRLVAEGSIEDKIGLLKEQKRSIAAAVLDGGTAAALGPDDLAVLFGDATDVDVSDEDGPVT